MMGTSCLHGVLDELSLAYDGVGAEALLAGEPMALHGVCFFMHCNAATPDFLTVYCEFGALPDDRRELACQVLLEANLVLAHQGGALQSFALDPDTAVVVAAAHLALSQLNVACLRALLAELAEQAMAWRSDYFLGSPAPPPAPPPSHVQQQWRAGQGAAVPRTAGGAFRR